MTLRIIASFLIATLTSGYVSAASSNNDPCAATDLRCIKIALDRSADEIDRLSKELALQTKRGELFKEESQLLREQVVDLQGVNKFALEAAKGAQRAWFEHPLLWAGGGVLVGIGLTCLGAWAVGQVAGHQVPSR